MEDRLLKIEEVALNVGVSTETIRHWYTFKNKFPENEYASLLPDINRDSIRKTMYWKQSDIWKLLEFKKMIPRGRNGVMGCVTQRYLKKGE